MNRHILITSLAIAVACSTASAQGNLTYVDLVKRLTDLEGLSVLPAQGDTCAQWSSYDRASRFDEVTGKYVKWDANDDGPGIIRKEGDLEVLAEMEGPGCIWRIWSAKADAGHVRIYLDGAAEPAVDLPFKDYFNCTAEPFVYPSLVHMTARGINNYVPIPYKKSCKIVAEKGWGRYFQFVYETFPKGTEAPTFSRKLSADETAALKAADELMTVGLGTDPAGARPGLDTVEMDLALAPGAAMVLPEIAGPRAITSIKARVDVAPEEAFDALRQIAIRITWDGEAQPAVWAPLGDFFGTAPGINKYKSLPLGMTDDGFYSFWYMPFAKSARVKLVNDGPAARKVRLTVTVAPLTKPVETLGRFHAKWHRDAFLPAEPERAIDWTMLKTAGRGRFVGVMLHVWNPRGSWWGEGDEKFFVDGEKFPSTIGTGSEDYFGYAWCCPDLFQNAYHNQTISMGNKGHVSVNRWHIADNVPFQKSFEGCIEKYYLNVRPTLYAGTVYWYLAPGGEDAYGPASADDRTGYYVALPPVSKVKGALEAEALKVLKATGGQARRQDMAHYTGGAWSDEAQLWWTGGKPGDRLDLEVSAEKAGKYRLSTNLTKAVDYGIIRLELDGKALGDPIDCWNDGVIATGSLDLGTHDLAAGKHTFSVVITGANPKMRPGHMAGVDYVKLDPAP